MTTNADSIAVVRALASELGLTVEPTVLAEKSNLVLRLAPLPLVARVALATSVVRVGMAWLRREVEVTRFLDERGIAVTRPTRRIDAGPFERSGLVISFWELEEVLDEPADPRASGKALALAHRALAEYPRECLPLWGGFEEARLVVDRARSSPCFEKHELHRLESAWEEAERIVVSAAARSESMQAVHGDAHTKNVLATTRGVVWADWEDAFVGPVEFDIACLRSRAEIFGEDRDVIDALTDAYDAPYDRDLARDLLLVRNVQVIPWLAVFAERQPEILPRMRARIEHLPTPRAIG